MVFRVQGVQLIALFSSRQVGTPFCVTIDFDSLEDNTVTVPPQSPIPNPETRNPEHDTRNPNPGTYSGKPVFLSFDGNENYYTIRCY
jgi:hypothetical protein